MKYMGSKNRISKELKLIIQEYIEKYNIKTYIEPFVGGANMIDKIECDEKVGSDSNQYLIELLNFAKNNAECLIEKLPKSSNKELYLDIREDYKKNGSKYNILTKGIYGFLASYCGKFFDSYSGVRTTKDGKVRDYYDESKRNLCKQAPNLIGIEFHCRDYSYYTDFKGCLFYLDPPYANTNGYMHDFNSEDFWEWVRNLSKNNIVLVSEYNAPDDFEKIWCRELVTNINRADGKNKDKNIECLFKYKGGIKYESLCSENRK